MSKNKFLVNTRRLASLMLCMCMIFSIAATSAFAAGSRTCIEGKVYEFDKDNDYTFSETTSYKGTADATTYGEFSVQGIEAEIVATGKKNGVPSYSVSAGNLTISYTYTDALLNADNDEWHLVEDKNKNVDIYKLDSNIEKGAIILQRSNDHLNWNTVSTQTNVFANTPKQNDSMYETLDVELINGCYYRLIVVYQISKLVNSSKVLGIFTNDEYETKRVAEVYEFYAETDNEYIQDLQTNTRRYRLGDTVRVSDFASYSGSEEMKKDDIHYNWDLGDFFVSGFTSRTDYNGETVFLKNVGDVVTLWFNLEQDINAINNDPELSITADPDGYDQYFHTDMTNFGRGMLIIRYTDCDNVKHDPVMYYDFLEANATLGANTRVQLFEEGDYEVALDYEVTKDQLIDQVGHYRIFFKFSVRNANCMVYPFDTKTNAELTNTAVTPNGFYLDLARSRYLNIYIEKEVWTEGADGLTKDTRFNTTAKDGDKYTDEGIYTITAENRYTGLKTTKTIYVGTNRILMAYMTSNYSLAEIQDMVLRGATIYDDGTIEMPPEMYSVTYEFVSGSSGMELPEDIMNTMPLNQANKEDGEEVFPEDVTETAVKVDGGTWTFQGWDAAGKVIDCADQVFIGTWVYVPDETEESQTDNAAESETTLDTEENEGTTDSPDQSGTEEDESTDTTVIDEPNNSSFGTIAVIAVIAAAALLGFILLKKKRSNEEA